MATEILSLAPMLHSYKRYIQRFCRIHVDSEPAIDIGGCHFLALTYGGAHYRITGGIGHRSPDQTLSGGGLGSRPYGLRLCRGFDKSNSTVAQLVGETKWLQHFGKQVGKGLACALHRGTRTVVKHIVSIHECVIGLLLNLLENGLHRAVLYTDCHRFGLGHGRHRQQQPSEEHHGTSPQRPLPRGTSDIAGQIHWFTVFSHG